MKNLAKHKLGTPHTINGVEGHMLRVPNRDRTAWDLQAFSAVRHFPGEGGEFLVYLTFDCGQLSGNECYFSMRREFEGVSGPLDDQTGEDLLNKHWPELAHLARWNLCSLKGPHCYYSNCSYWQATEGNVDALRRAAVWPDMPEELFSPLAKRELKEALTARLPGLPGLIEAFKSDLLACGFLLNP